MIFVLAPRVLESPPHLFLGQALVSQPSFAFYHPAPLPLELVVAFVQPPRVEAMLQIVALALVLAWQAVLVSEQARNPVPEVVPEAWEILENPSLA